MTLRDGIQQLMKAQSCLHSESSAVAATPSQHKRPRYVVLAAGSNAEGQLGIGHYEDAHTWQPCRRQCPQAQSSSGVALDAGDEDFFPPEGWHVQELSSGANHTIALVVHDAAYSTNGTRIFVSGTNASGQLGEASNDRAGQYTSFHEVALKDIVAQTSLDISKHWIVRHVAAGWDWTLLALTSKTSSDDDVLVVLGTSNDFGQLGIGKDEEKKDATFVHLIALGAALLPHRRPGDRLVIDALACGVRHTLALVSLQPSSTESSNHQQHHFVLAWGAARHGQCGEMTKVAAMSQNTGKSSHKRAGPAVAWTPQIASAFVSEHFPSQDQEKPRIYVGKEHSAVIVPSHWQMSGKDARAEGAAKVLLFGSNRQGQSVLPKELVRPDKDIIAFGCTWNTSLVLQYSESSGVLSLTGSGAAERGQLARDPAKDDISAPVIMATLAPGERAVAMSLACGSEHALLLLPGGSVLGWGWNEHGNLAQGQDVLEDCMDPVAIWPASQNSSSALPSALLDSAHGQATDVWAGCGTSFILVRMKSSGKDA